MSRVRRGFTLIELLVVIAIIAILAAILFPVFVGVKKKARKSTCNSNMKSIATAFQAYIDDYEAFPDHTSVGLPYTGDGNAGEGSNWIRQFSHRYQTNDGGSPAGMAKVLGPYLKSRAVFKCPSEWKERPEYAETWFPLKYAYIAGSSYYYKHAICWMANKQEHPVKQSQLKYTTRCTLLYEEAWHGDSSPFLWDADLKSGDEKLPTFKQVSAIFMDLHVGRINVPLFRRPAFPDYGYDGNWFFYTGASRDKYDYGHNREMVWGGRDIF